MWNRKKVSNIYIFLSLHQVFVTSNGNTARLSFKCIQLSAFKMIFNNILHFWTTQTKHRYLYSCLQLDFFFSITNTFTIPLKHLIITFNVLALDVSDVCFEWDWCHIFTILLIGSIKVQEQNKQLTATWKLFLLVPVSPSAVCCMCVIELNHEPGIDNRITVNPEWNLSPLLL